MDKTIYNHCSFGKLCRFAESDYGCVYPPADKHREFECIGLLHQGVHKYTITAWTDKDTIEKVTKQITKKIDVLQAHYFTDDEIYQHEIALYKITTLRWKKTGGVKVIRKYNARIVEVNAVFAIVEKNGMSEEITALYEELRQLDCVLQFVRSGRVAITTSCFERVNEYLADREAKYRQSKHQEL